MDLAVMIEGQDGLTWERWKRIARTVEDLGFAGLYRSDHYTNARPPEKDSLELWTSLTWLADNTDAIEFGPLVTPPSYRHPSMVARYAAAIDDLSGGRLHLGLGGGWQEREHTMFGLDLLEMGPRFRRFEESVQVIKALLQSDEPVDFSGEFYTLEQAILLPRPERDGGPPILIGGNGENKTLRYVARYADMWNGLYMKAERYGELNAILDDYLNEEGRRPADVHRSIMTGLTYHPDNAVLEQRIEKRGGIERLREAGVLVGGQEEVLEGLHDLADEGCQRVMVQWLHLDDMDGLTAFAEFALQDFPTE
ncbi:MAG: TIGR03560 family F420-dependent LLM class oxidoreductase [Chloroflexi bacterium]|nr:TIGR03560 family F420-dependent LLM class oxidoreductase [Chloroflexota bacterium]